MANPTDCILHCGCVHAVANVNAGVGSCRSLGMCGAQYALNEASKPGGYRVITGGG